MKGLPSILIGDGPFPELEIQWPHPRPESFSISATTFEAMIKEINAHRKLCRARDEVDESIASELS